MRYCTVRTLHILACLIFLSGVSWSLLSPDPFAAVGSSPLRYLARLDDFVLHLGVYGGFTVLCYSLVLDAEELWVRQTVLALLCSHGLLTECLQAFVPGRTCDPVDAVANLLGISVAAVLTPRLVRWLVRRPVSATA